VLVSELMFRPALADKACGYTAKSRNLGLLSCFSSSLTCKVPFDIISSKSMAQSSCVTPWPPWREASTSPRDGTLSHRMASLRSAMSTPQMISHTECINCKGSGDRHAQGGRARLAAYALLQKPERKTPTEIPQVVARKNADQAIDGGATLHA
jgi:hypothetical protein